MDSQIEDNRGFWVHVSAGFDEYPLTTNARCVYLHIVRRAGGNGDAFPSYQSIGDHCFLLDYANAETRRKKAIQAVKELNEKRLISIRKRRNGIGGNISNVYALNPSQMWASAESIKVKYANRLPANIDEEAGHIYSLASGDMSPPSHISPLGGHISSLPSDISSLARDQISTLRNSTQGDPLKGIPLKEESPLAPQGGNSFDRTESVKNPEPDPEPSALTCQSEVIEETEPISAIALPKAPKGSAKKSRQSKKPSAAEVEEARVLYNNCKPDRWSAADVMNADRVKLFARLWEDARSQGVDWRDLMERALAGAKVDPFWGQQVQGTMETLYYKRRYQMLSEQLSAKGMSASAIHDSGLSVADIQKAKKAHERPDVSRFVAGIIR